jgi:hypothetical protein
MGDATYVVVKAFKTLTRRLKEGVEITAAEIDGALTAEDWRARGFLKPKDADPPVEPAPAWADPPTV